MIFTLKTYWRGRLMTIRHTAYVLKLRKRNLQMTEVVAVSN